jgi:hypothetical protein
MSSADDIQAMPDAAGGMTGREPTTKARASDLSAPNVIGAFVMSDAARGEAPGGWSGDRRSWATRV